MGATKREKDIYGDEVRIVSRTDECTIYQLAGKTGDVVMTSYHVFPGIELVYNDVHVQKYKIKPASAGNVFEISHCREGRIECDFQEEFFYLSPGDLSISCKGNAVQESYFPLGHYHGVSVMIDADLTPSCLSCFLDDVNVQPAALMKKYLSGRPYFVERSKPYLEHIFSELYSVPDSIKKGYFKVKVLELLLFLSAMDMDESGSEKSSYTRTQVTLAKDVCQYLTGHMEQRITINQLADVFHVSPTHLKKSFKGVYGISVYAYIRAQKMQSAAIQLLSTEDTILAVAGSYGYDNGSKFAKAFQDVMGMTPTQYRMEKYGTKCLNGVEVKISESYN